MWIERTTVVYQNIASVIADSCWNHILVHINICYNGKILLFCITIQMKHEQLLRMNKELCWIIALLLENVFSNEFWRKRKKKINTLRVKTQIFLSTEIQIDWSWFNVFIKNKNQVKYQFVTISSKWKREKMIQSLYES